MTTVVLGLAAALGWGVTDLLNMRVSRFAAPRAALFWMFVAGAATAGVLALPSGSWPSGEAQWRAVGFAVVTGALYPPALGAFLLALRSGSLSVIGPLSGLEGAVAVVIAFALGERVGAFAVAGLVLATIGGALAAAGSGRGQRTTAGAGWALLTALIFGLMLVLYGEADALPAATVVVISRVVSLALLVPVALRRGVRLPAGRRRLVLGVGVLDVGALIVATIALGRGPLSVASVVVTQFATVAVVLGIVVLHERPARHQLAGVVMVIVAVSLLAAAV